MRSPSTDTVGAPLSAVPAVDARERQPGDTRPVGGLRMSQVPFTHRPVMLDKVTDVLSDAPAGASGLLVDATLGGAGHSAALLDRHPGLHLVGIDRDPDALAAAAERLSPWSDRVRLRRARFDGLADEVAAARDDADWDFDLPVVAVLFDLGVSSPQLDRPERGFSYRVAGPLDMRMDPAQGLTASDVVNSYDERALTDLFRANGEGRFAHRIARSLISARPIPDTATLAELIRESIPAPARRRGGHPAKRVFQAIRIEVNGELDVLNPALESALGLLAPGGRLAVLTYHSGEDRIVKETFRVASTGGCVCPPGLPCVCGAVPGFRLVFRGSRTATETELRENPRAESARLRVIERIPDGPLSGGSTSDERARR